MKNNYIYYEASTEEWKPATLEELAALDDPELPVCVLDAAGNPGAQTTYAAIQRCMTQAPPVSAPVMPRPNAPAMSKEVAQMLIDAARLSTYRFVRWALSIIAAILFVFLWEFECKTSRVDGLTNLLVVLGVVTVGSCIIYAILGGFGRKAKL